VRALIRALIFLLLAALAAGGAWWWLNQPLQLSEPSLELEIEPGTTPRGVAQNVVKAGVQTDARLLYAWFRFSGKDRAIKAGNYELSTGLTPYVLLQKLARGEESLRALTLVEGWNWRQVRAALAREEFLKQDSAGLSDEAVMTALGGGRAARRPLLPRYLYLCQGQLGHGRAAPCAARHGSPSGRCLGHAGGQYPAQIRRRGPDPGQHRGKGNRPRRRPARRLPAFSPTACA
jgi:hypothetical protein